MEIKTLYKVISGESAEIEHLLNTLSRDGCPQVFSVARCLLGRGSPDSLYTASRE